MTRPSGRLVGAVAAGGALGAVLRWGCGEVLADGLAVPVTLAVNVVGSLLLALLPALASVRRSPSLAAFAGPGLLGGFTTLSAASEQTRALLADGRPGPALGYLLGTLLATVAAVALASRLARRQSR